MSLVYLRVNNWILPPAVSHPDHPPRPAPLRRSYLLTVGWSTRNGFQGSGAVWANGSRGFQRHKRYKRSMFHTKWGPRLIAKLVIVDEHNIFNNYGLYHV